MKRFATFLMVFSVLFLLMGAALTTDRSNYITIRSNADGADSAQTDLSWSAASSTYRKRISDSWNEIVFTFVCDTADATFTDAEIWGYVKGASAQLLWVGSGVAGAAVDDNGYYIADTLTTTTDETAAGVTLNDEGGNDRHATLRFDLRECEYVLVVTPTVSAGDWFVYATGD